MNINTLKYCLALLIILAAKVLVAQSDILEETDLKPSEVIFRYMLDHPNENFVIQTDRDLYFSGTELRFSVWSLDDQTLIPRSYSNIVYVELMDNKGTSIDHQILKLEFNMASGRMILTEQLTSGMYYLRAYTSLQRNYGEHLFGIKLIQIINPSKPPDITIQGIGSKPVVSVFPEGERLLYGITNRLVVKATYPNGLFVALTDGFLIRQAHDTIAEIKFPVPGLGHCSFFADTSYSYHLDLPGIGIYPLQIQEEGLTLSIKEEVNQLRLMVLGKKLPYLDDHYLIGKSRGYVFFEKALEKDPMDVVLPYSSLPEGLLEFSILSSGFEEYCQRLYYHDLSRDSLAADLVLGKTSFEKGEIIEMQIVLPEEKDFELLSLSVSKDFFLSLSLNQKFQTSIDLHPFLNDWDECGQLIQGIPSKRFTDILDLHLITRKSSKFTWKDIAKGPPERLHYMPEVDYKHVTGYVFNPSNGMRIKNDNLEMFIVGKEAAILNSRTDHDGRFRFEFPVQRFGNSEVVIQSYVNDKRMEISLNWPFHQSFFEYKLDFFHFDSTRFEEYDNAYVLSLLENMYGNTDKPGTKYENRNVAFYGMPDARKYLENYLSMQNMEEVFKEIVPGERLRIRDDHYSLQVYHRDKYDLLGDHPLILFNGVPILNLKEVLEMPVSRVDFVDMVRQQYVIHNQVFDGIINIVSKDLNLQLKIPPDAFRTTMEVFSVRNQFNKAEEKTVERIPDLNPTLYWNPNLSMQGNTKSVHFLAGNNPGRYHVRLRGIDTEGKILELERYITVE